MARAFGRILASIWDDEDFIDLSPEEQRLYFFLLSQSNLNHAGLLPLTLRRWAKKAKKLTATQLEEQLEALEQARFVVLDYDTEELLVRSLVRNDSVYKQPRVMGAMVADAKEIASRKLRRALLAEIDRIPLGELSDDPGPRNAPSIRSQVAKHIDDIRTAFGTTPPPPEPRSEPLPEDPWQPLPDPPAEDLPEGGAEGYPKVSTRVDASPCARALPQPVAPSPSLIPEPPAAPTARGDAPGPVSPAQLTLIPGLPADEPPGRADGVPKQETEGQRVYRLAHTYTDRVKLSNYNAVAGVVKKAVRETADDGERRYTDHQIEDALTRLRETGWGVSTETLRRALERPSNPVTIPAPRPSATARAIAEVDAATAAAKAELEAMRATWSTA